MVLCIISMVISVVGLILFFILVDGTAGTIIVALISSAWPLIMRAIGIVYGAKGRKGAYEDADAGGDGVAQGQAA